MTNSEHTKIFKAAGIEMWPSEKIQAFRKALLDWYDKEKRDLPWRRTSDPYSIWVSEIMLQQTRVDTVIPYYHNFLDKFPDIAALAAAPEDAILKAWEGLGYYSRVKNMQKAAQQIVADY
ncbi:MAG: A/G-specific adenine glycosylase, partial [Trichococcus flocculiformis]